MAYDLGTAEGKIVIDSSGVDGAVNDANASLGKLGKKGGFNAQEFGTAMTVGVTAPIIGVGVVALKTAVDFETAFAGVIKTVDGTEKELAGLRDGIIDMANRLPASREEIAGVAEAAGQLGIEIPNILGFTETMIGLGEATNLSADEAATSLARFANIMQMPQTEFDKLGSVIVGLGNNMATTEAEIVEFAMRIAGAGKAVGLTEAETMSMAAALSSLGIEAAAGGTSVSKTLIEMNEWVAKGADELGILAEQVGMTTDEFGEMFRADPAQAFVKYVEALQNVKAEGGDVLLFLDELGVSEIRQRDALLRLAGAGDILTEALELGTQAWDENSALQNEVAQRYETTAAQMDIAKNNATNVLRILGEAFIPVLRDMTSAMVPVAQMIGGMASAFGALPEPVRKLVAGFLLLLAAIGPTILIGLKVVKTVKTIATAFKALGIVMAMNPFVLIVLAIIALIAGFVLLYKRSEKFRKFINDLGKNIAKAWGAVVDFFKSLPKQFSKIWDSVTGAFKKAGKAVEKAFERVIQFFKDLPGIIGGALADAAGAVVDFGADVVNAVVGFVSELPGKVAAGMQAMLTAFVNFMKQLPEQAAYWLGFLIGRWIKFHIDLVKRVVTIGVEVLKAIVDFLKELPGLALEWTMKFLNAVVDFGLDLVSKIIEIGTDVVTTLITKLTEFITWLPGFLLDVIQKIIQWGVEFVQAAISAGIDFVTGLINAIIGLPGQVFGIVMNIITGLPGFISQITSAAFDLGKNLVTGFFSGIGDIVGLLYDMVWSAINGIGDLGQMAWNKAKSVGSSIWNGFKSGLGINSPSYVEEAMFALTDNVAASINTLGSQVRELQTLSRSVPGVGQSEPFGGQVALALADGAAGRLGGDAGSVGLVVQGPLLHVEHMEGTDEEIIEVSRKLADMTYVQLEAQGNRSARVNGAFNADG